MGLYWGGYLDFRPEVLTQSLAVLLDWHRQGRISPHVSHALPLDRVEEGMALLRERRSTGKVVIEIADP
jgi:NADPH2:quinone reductase